ncbi:MAG TPA: sortase [Patescibacteria group bacterium]|nr:sortase [Patescibacteria group bacterium]
MDKDLLHKYSTYDEDYQYPVFPEFNRKVSKITGRLAKWLGIAGIILILIGFAPSIWYTVTPKKFDLSKLIAATFRKENKSNFAVEDKKQEESTYQPRFDPNLPKENRIKIPSVKMETSINEASWENYENALKISVWRVPDFGTPTSRTLPMILAAHRYGYLRWSIPYRLKNSFYNLSKLKVGDTVEITWEQRKYIYEVYKESEGEEITDYSSDLILYTCESLNSPVRIFKYARLLEI